MANSKKRPSESRPNWDGVKATRRWSSLFVQDFVTKKMKAKDGVKVHGFVTKNHASTITSAHNGRYGPYQEVVGSTHSLSQRTQAEITNCLDDPKMNSGSKIWLYDDVPFVKKGAKK